MLGVGGVGRYVVSQEDANADRALCAGPIGDRLDHGGIGWVDRLHQSEPVGMSRINLNCIARVVAIHAKGRDQHGAVDPDRIHRGHHLVAGHLRRTIESPDPRAARVVALVGMDLGI